MKPARTERTHQVLEEGGELLGEGGELDEGRAQVRVVPAYEVAAKLVQGLGIVLLILDVVWGDVEEGGGGRGGGEKTEGQGEEMVQKGEEEDRGLF